MKYIRLRIANYRAVSEAKLDFGENGITLVRGPNEIGKTSLGESIRLLFEYPDNSKHSDIIDVIPVHIDAGPEIELEAESGGYRFIYTKRFSKKPETKLNIVKPKPENLTGRQAHDRANAILRETLDVNLWKALSIRQGTEINQPKLIGQTWLSAALDREAGGHSADPHAESLFDSVRKEYLTYFTENGAERKEVTEVHNAPAVYQADIQRNEQAIRDLDHDVDHATGLRKEIVQLRRTEQDIVAEAEKHTVRLKEISELNQQLSRAHLKLEAAKASEKAARAEKDNRARLVNEVVNMTKVASQMSESAVSNLASLNQAKEELEKAQQAYSDATNKRKEIIELTDLQRRDYEYHRDKLDLDLLLERKNRIDQAREDAAKSKAILATNKVDEEAIKSINAAQTSVTSAEARLESKAPIVLLRGLDKCTLTKDGAPIKLEKGEEQSYSVPDTVKFSVPGKLEMEITAGSSIDTLVKRVDETRSKLQDLCTSVGIDGPDKAHEAFEERLKASRQIENLKQVEKENLRDLSYDKLSELILGLQKSVPSYLPGRVATPKISPNLDSAKAKMEETDKARSRAEEEWKDAESVQNKVNKMYESRNDRYIEARTRWQHQTEDATRMAKTLEKERANTPDDIITETLNNSVTEVEKAQISVKTIESSLKALNPEQELELDETAKESLDRIQHRLKDADRELIEISTRLKINGQDGLHDKLNVVQTMFERAMYKDVSLGKRVTAAKLLYETMRQERDNARHAYVAPLKDRIEALGRLVFDDTLHVEVSDNLQIVSRTLQGTTVNFDSLSSGAKEQLSLILRLACTMIVAKDGGAPLMLDDTLGYTDPDRLLLMGAVLAKAAKECQIVIFTCIPDRYSNIGAAKEIVMG